MRTAPCRQGPCRRLSRARRPTRRRFAAALLDPERATPAAVAGPRGKAAARRYNVYRNNVTVSLIDALAAVYPATQRITGPEFFRAMARFHVRATPPTSPLLFEYGRDFPDFIAALRPMPRRCRGWRTWRGSSGPGSTPTTPRMRRRCAPRRAGVASRRTGSPDAVLTPHPAMRIVRSRYPGGQHLRREPGSGPVGRIAAAEPEDALITRPGLEVAVRRLPPGGAAFLARLAAGEPLGAAAAAALAESPAFDLAANIAGMLEAGAFTAMEGGLMPWSSRKPPAAAGFARARRAGERRRAVRSPSRG